MNRKLLLSGCLLLLAGSAHAQLGLRAGANTAAILTKVRHQGQQATADAKAGYQIGVFYEHKLGPRFSVVPELQFSRQRTQLQTVQSISGVAGVDTYTTDYRLSQSYLHLPVLLRARFGCFYAEAGPQISFQMASREAGTRTITHSYDISSHTRDFNRPATDGYRRFDVGLCAGLGVQLPGGFGLGLRGTAGLLPLMPAPEANYAIRQRSQTVQAAVSYQLRGGS